ncbi:MAG: hypothetical protein M3439_06930 [Chloroflexota bacterium]|nr:hypothetical protein [Chloroflexota bacterium]
MRLSREHVHANIRHLVRLLPEAYPGLYLRDRGMFAFYRRMGMLSRQFRLVAADGVVVRPASNAPVGA